MPVKTIPNSDIQYYLICYDKHGNERRDDPDIASGVLSEEVIRQAQSGKYTDIFFSSHGWKGDIPAAIDQYNRWMGSMLQCKADIARLKARPQGFKALIIGLHWPSLPYGQEDYEDATSSANDNELDTGSLDFSIAVDDGSDNDIYQEAADAIADSDTAKQAIATIIDSAGEEMNPIDLPEEVEAAFNSLIAEFKNNKDDGLGKAPGDDIPDIDAKGLYEAIQETFADDSLDSFAGGGGRGWLLKGLTQFSIWSMKKRGRKFGENGAAKLLRKLQSVTSPSVGFHLMGHSLGCVVISSTITGQGAKQAPLRPVDTVFLVQGAVSFWAFCKDIPVKQGTAGYYHRLSSSDYVSGSILVTLTENDKAVGTIYPLAAKVGMSPDFKVGELPKHGGLGTFGMRGDGIRVQDLDILPSDGAYHFENGQIYNIDTSRYMTITSGASGAHSDIDHPEVAHIFWSGVV